MTDTADWKAPPNDGGLLVWPDPSTLPGRVAQNHRSVESSVARLSNLSLPQLRRSIRRELQLGEEPIVATGHQTELYHPGVWIKDAVTSAVGATALHVAVDTDQPKHLSLKWPGGSIPITDDPALTTAEWSGRLASPTVAHLDRIESMIRAAAVEWPFDSGIFDFLSVFRSVADEPLSKAVTQAQFRFDHSLGLTRRSVIASTMFESPAYLAFVHDLMANAGRFAVEYNRALAEYRVEAGIKSPTRPMPDLAATAESIESPFWLDHLPTGRRRRASVAVGGRFLLVDGDDRFEFDPAADGFNAAARLKSWLSDRGLRIAPRALTLTTFLRLIVVDLFVHGIGGGRYDQVTDKVIDRYFGMTPPGFAVATATKFWPGAEGRQRACLPCLAQEEHQLRHRLLGDRKRAVVAAIESLPRRSIQRSLAFHNFRSALAAAAIDNPVLIDFARRRREAEEAHRQQGDLFDRELFYAFQPVETLRRMAA